MTAQYFVKMLTYETDDGELTYEYNPGEIGTVHAQSEEVVRRISEKLSQGNSIIKHLSIISFEHIREPKRIIYTNLGDGVWQEETYNDKGWYDTSKEVFGDDFVEAMIEFSRS